MSLIPVKTKPLELISIEKKVIRKHTCMFCIVGMNQLLSTLSISSENLWLLRCVSTPRKTLTGT